MFVDLIQAVAVGLILSSILFMKQMSDQLGSEVKILPIKENCRQWWKENIPDSIADKIYVKHFPGPIFFGFAPALLAMAESLPDIRVVIFRMMNVPNIDQTGLYALEEVVLSLEKRNIAVVITGLQKQPYRMLQRINMVPGLIPENYIFDEIEDCIQWLGEELRKSAGGEEAFFDMIGNKALVKSSLKYPLKYRM